MFWLSVQIGDGEYENEREDAEHDAWQQGVREGTRDERPAAQHHVGTKAAVGEPDDERCEKRALEPGRGHNVC